MTVGHGEEYLHELNNARTDLVAKKAKLRIAQENFNIAKALAEQEIIEEAGGEKALGSNETARQREMTVRLSQLPADSEYQKWLEKLDMAQLEYDLAVARLETLKDQRRDYESFLKEQEIDVYTTGPVFKLDLAGDGK